MGEVSNHRMVPPATNDRSGHAATIQVAEAPKKAGGGLTAKPKALPPAPLFESKQTLQALLKKLTPEGVAKVAKHEVTAFQVAEYELPAKTHDILYNSGPTTTTDEKMALIDGAEAAVKRHKERAEIAAHHYLDQQQKRSPQDPKKISDAERLVRKAEAKTPRGLAETAEDNMFRVFDQLDDQLKVISSKPHTAEERSTLNQSFHAKIGELKTAASENATKWNRALEANGDDFDVLICEARYKSALEYVGIAEAIAPPP